LLVPAVRVCFSLQEGDRKCNDASFCFTDAHRQLCATTEENSGQDRSSGLKKYRGESAATAAAGHKL